MGFETSATINNLPRTVMAVLLALGALACAVAAPLPHAHTTALPEATSGHAEDGAQDFDLYDDISIDSVCNSFGIDATSCDGDFEECVRACKILFDMVCDSDADYALFDTDCNNSENPCD